MAADDKQQNFNKPISPNYSSSTATTHLQHATRWIICSTWAALLLQTDKRLMVFGHSLSNNSLHTLIHFGCHCAVCTMMPRVFSLHIWGLALVKTLRQPSSNRGDMFSSAAGSDCGAGVLPPLMRRSRCSITNITQVKNLNCVFEVRGRKRLFSKQDHALQEQEGKQKTESGRGRGTTTEEQTNSV